MPIKVEATQTVIVDYDGKKEEKAKTVVTAKCDGPKCGKPDSICPSKYTWVEQEPDDIPDGVFRMIIIQDFEGHKVVLFSKECVRDLMRNYVAPLSPREKARIAENNAKINDTVVDPPVFNPTVLQNGAAGSSETGQGGLQSPKEA